VLVDEHESPKSAPAATPALRCPSCGTVLKAEGLASGAWVRCPNCSQPVRFEAPKPPRPKPAAQPIIKPSISVPPGVTEWTPRPAASRRLGCGPALVISILAGITQTAFVAMFHYVRNPWELLFSFVFGCALVLTTGYLMVAVSNRTGWESTRHDR
jgi:hypothetical protein